MNYEDHKSVIESLRDDQAAEERCRKEIDEVIEFVHVDQWEDNVKSTFSKRPRYTFDQTKPIISDIWAEMAVNDYAAKIDPVGDGATEDVANLQNGLIRSIYSQSSFDDTSTKAGKRMIMGGFSAWRVRTKIIGESFYQDIAIDYIPDSHRRVWYDCLSEMQTREDANHVHVLSANIHSNEAKKKWGKYKGRKSKGFVSVDNAASSSEEKQRDVITVGEIIYRESYLKTIYLVDDDFSTVTDDKGLARMNLSPDSAEVIDERQAECFRVYSRKYDGAGWLEDKKLTVFSYLPVIPCYAHFDVIDGCVSYEGAIRQVMDACRVFNYSESRKIEEQVLAMRRKLMADNRAVSGYEDEFENLNRDPRAVQTFNGAEADKIKHTGGPFFEVGGAQPNAALTELSGDMLRNIQLGVGRPNAVERARVSSNDSNFRADLRESMGQVGTFEYYRGYKIALEHTLKVIVSGMPKVYDTFRKVTTIDESNQASEVEINKPDATGQIINNLTVGKYTSTVSIGKDMESRKAQANDGLKELGQYDPTIISRNTDILASNINAPGMSAVADRERAFLFKNGAIPEDQWTEDEKRQMQELSQQPQQPDAATLIAQAEMKKAEFQALEAQAKLELQQNDQSAKQNIEAVKLELMKQKQDYDNLLKAVQAEKISIENGQPIGSAVVNSAEQEI